MPAAASCSWANRAYGSGLACKMAMRSSGVPARAASTIDAHGRPDLFVAVRGRDDPRALPVDDGQRTRRRQQGAPPVALLDAADRSLDLGVGSSITRGPGENHDLAARRRRHSSSLPA